MSFTSTASRPFISFRCITGIFGISKAACIAAQNMTRKARHFVTDSFKETTCFFSLFFRHYKPHVLIIIFILLILPFITPPFNDSVTYVECKDNYAIKLEDREIVDLGPIEQVFFVKTQSATYLKCEYFDKYYQILEKSEHSGHGAKENRGPTSSRPHDYMENGGPINIDPIEQVFSLKTPTSKVGGNLPILGTIETKK